MPQAIDASPPSREQCVRHFDALDLQVNEPEPALICRHACCRFVLRPSVNAVVGHLTKKHNVKKPNAGRIATMLLPLGLVGPDELALRPDGEPPIAHLAVRRGAR